MLANMRSIVNKINELHIIADIEKVEIMALCETWLNTSIPDAFINCNGRYNVYRRDRDSRGGGVCLLVSKSFCKDAIPVSLPDVYKSLEILAVDILKDNVKTRIVLVYRPPGNTYDIVKNELFAKALQYLASPCHREIILGDFNLPFVDWSTFSYPAMSSCNALFEYLMNNGSHQIVDFPTREENILDLVFVNDPLLISNVTMNPPISSSDHNCVLFNFHFNYINVNSNCLNNIPVSVCKSYCFHEADWQSINDCLCNIDWLDTFSQCFTVDDYWSCFRNIIITLLDKYVPTRLSCEGGIENLNSKRPKYPLSIKKLLNKKALAWKLYSKFKTPQLKLKYNILSEKCKLTINNFSSSSEDKIIQTENLGAFYKYVNSKTSTRSGVSLLYGDAKALKFDHPSKAEILNSFFFLLSFPLTMEFFHPIQ
jgi:hypothetical protein